MTSCAIYGQKLIAVTFAVYVLSINLSAEQRLRKKHDCLHCLELNGVMTKNILALSMNIELKSAHKKRYSHDAAGRCRE